MKKKISIIYKVTYAKKMHLVEAVSIELSQKINNQII